jgi:signal transduction histidine kinase
VAAPASLRKDRSARRLFLVFGAVLASVLLTNVITQTFSSRIESLSNDIVFNTAPSIERLAALRGATLETELRLSAYLQQGGSDASLGRLIDESLERLNRGIQQYLDRPIAPGEQRHWATLQDARIRFDQAVRRTRELAEAGNQRDANQMFRRVVEPLGTTVLDAAMRAVESNAHHGRVLATRIEETRRRTIWWLNGLTAFSILLGAAGALIIQRQTLQRRTLVEAHARFLEDRAAELEQFAGRVAHDIRNPLSSAAMTAQLIERRATDEHGREIAHRVIRSLERAAAITSGLLDFARAGAKPDPGARTSPREVLADLATSLTQEAAHAGIELLLEPIPPVRVACSEGVYLSLVGNLARNAIKYMGDSAERLIRIRLIDEGTFVRTEVSDTGPGIAAAALPSLFASYFRAGGTQQDGLGLGLATVKKLAEGHGGRAGVRSELGKGSTFWFTLPRAGRLDDPRPDQPAPPGANPPTTGLRH